MAQKQARIKDIAERAGVSTGTVDRVLHNRGEVSPRTRKKILDIVAELEYQPNVLASTLASRKTTRFGVLIPEGSKENPYWLDPLKGILRAALELQSYGVEIIQATYKPGSIEDFRTKSHWILTQDIQGLLLAPVFHKESQRFLQDCLQAKLPVVFIDAQIDYQLTIQFIGQNACQSGHVAGRLLGLGNTENAHYLVFNIASDKDQLYHFSERVSGFRNFFASRNLEVRIQIEDIQSNHQSAIRSILQKALSTNQVIDGILVSGSKSFMVAQELEALECQHVRLLGFDLVGPNLEHLQKETIDFLISQQPEEQGYRGIQSLYSALVQKQEMKRISYTPIDIVTRENLVHYLECP